MCLYDIKVITGMSVGDLRTGQLDNRIMTVGLDWMGQGVTRCSERL